MGGWTTPGRRWVYFAERKGLVKIGYSANVDQRMRQLLDAAAAGHDGEEACAEASMKPTRPRPGWNHSHRHAECERLTAIRRAEVLGQFDPKVGVVPVEAHHARPLRGVPGPRGAQIEDDRTDRQDRARQRLPIASYPGFAEADRRAAEIIERALGLAS